MKKMKNFKKVVMMLTAMAILSVPVYAQNNKTDDSHYLSNAVPEQNGKVVFSKSYAVSGMNKEAIYDRILKYFTARMAQNKNAKSRIIYANKDEGIVAAHGEEWLVFANKALTLDRSGISYQITATCSDGKCEISIAKINYTYGEKEKYTAEEWITDKNALNKDKTKLIRFTAKWRRHTVDLCDAYFAGIKETLNGKQADTATRAASIVQEEPKLIDVSADKISSDVADMISKSKVVIMVGNDTDDMTTMTAMKGATIGTAKGKQMIFANFDSSQPTSAIDHAEKYKLKFINRETREVLMIIDCQRQYSETSHGIYVLAGTITKMEISNQK
jgi:hypothetical protein